LFILNFIIPIGLINYALRQTIISTFNTDLRQFFSPPKQKASPNNGLVFYLKEKNEKK